MNTLLVKIAEDLVTIANELKNPKHLRYQAVFLIGAPGSGKSHVEQKWLKYMPQNTSDKKLTDLERSLSNLRFDEVIDDLAKQGVTIKVTEKENAKIPFVLYKDGVHIDPKDYKFVLPQKILSQITDIKEIIFSTPVLELPSYWRQVDSDLYKKEIAGYNDEDPGYVHYMSVGMAISYFEAILKTGDPFISSSSGRGMKESVERAKKAGYKISLVLVKTSLTSAQIRNAARPRKMDPGLLTRYWVNQDKYFSDLKSLADKIHVIDSRNDPVDLKIYNTNKESIEQFISKHGYDSLKDLIEKKMPGELIVWGKHLK